MTGSMTEQPRVVEVGIRIVKLCFKSRKSYRLDSSHDDDILQAMA